MIDYKELILAKEMPVRNENVKGNSFERGFSSGTEIELTSPYIPRSSLLYGHGCPPPLLPLLHKTSPGHILRTKNYMYGSNCSSENSSSLLSAIALPIQTPIENRSFPQKNLHRNPGSHEDTDFEAAQLFTQSNHYKAFGSNGKEIQEVEMTYNESNTPKFHGEFRTVKYQGQIRRVCRTCGATYRDLKGFNRHYKANHCKNATTNRNRNRNRKGYRR